MNIILLGANLFFSQKMAARLRQAGRAVHVVGSYEEVRQKVGLGISAVIIDLAAKGMDAGGIIKRLKGASETAKIPLIGFCGHQETALMDAARSAGCDLVTTNGVVSSDLEGLLGKIT